MRSQVLQQDKKDKLSEEEEQNIGVISFYKEWEKIH